MNKLKAHSIYLTGQSNAPLSEQISANLDSFKRNYSDFEHVLYTDASLRTFISENFESAVLWAYDQLIPLAYKADLGRYCLLYKLGGVYSDLSISFYRRSWLDDFGDKKIFFFRDGFSHAPWIISNSILMAKPEQLIFKYLIDEIVEHAKTKYYGYNPLCPTGPNLLGRTAAQLLDMDDFVTGEVVRINKKYETWSYCYLIPNGEVLAVNVKSGNGLASLGVSVSDNYNDHWNSKRIYKDADLLCSELNTVFDKNINGINLVKIKLEKAEARADQAETKAQQAEVKYQQTVREAQHLQSELDAAYGSKSWRITAPLRWFAGQIRRLRHEGLKVRIKSFIKKALRKINQELSLRPGLRQKILELIKRLGLENTLKRIYVKAYGQFASPVVSGFDQAKLKIHLENLSPRAKNIYNNLNHAIAQNKQEGK